MTGVDSHCYYAHMTTEFWHPVTRGSDRETVGYLEPLDLDYNRVQPRSVLGHPVGDPCGFVTGEDKVLERGIREIAEHWQLIDPKLPNALAILEVSPDAIVVAAALKTKAMVPTERFLVEWPATAERLVPWTEPNA